MGLSDHNFGHLLADQLLLRVLGVAGSLYLLSVSAGEAKAENTDEVAVLGLGLSKAFDKGVPLLDKGAKLITGNVNSVEVGVAVETFNFLALELDLSPVHIVSVTVQVSLGDFEDTSTEGVSSNL